MLFMVIEHFADNDMRPVYRRLRERGRMLPGGLSFVESWVEDDFSRCFQLMEADDVAPIEQWTRHWDGCGVRFEIAPVIASAEARRRVEAPD